MLKRLIASAIALAVLAGCGAAPAVPSSSSAPASSSEASSEAPEYVSQGENKVIFKDGKFVYDGVDALFTMDYEPSSSAVTKQHFGINFIEGYDTDWLGDNGNVANFNLHREPDATVFGSVAITTAPADIKAHYNVGSDSEAAEKMKAEFFTTESYYNGYRKNVAEDFGYEIVKEACGTAFEGGWNAFYVEFKDTDQKNRSMRFYLCNDEINEKFYSFMVKVDVPEGDTALMNAFRDMIFTIHPMG